VRVDFRFLAREERTESTWVKRSDDTPLRDRLVWLSEDTDQIEQLARDLHRSRAMLKKYEPRRESLSAARKLLLQQEKNNVEDLETSVRKAIAAAWLAGPMYFRSRRIAPKEQGASFAIALHAAATRVLPDLFPHFIATQVLPAELLQLVEGELAGPSPKFVIGDLGILELDAGRYVPTCNGIVPRRVQEYIEAEGGLGGTTLLAHFGGSPYGYTANVVKACVAGLLRASKVRLQPDGGKEITASRDAGVRDLFEKDREFRRATIFPAGEDDIGFQARARICAFFGESLALRMDREDDAIANAVAQQFPQLAQRLRACEGNLDRLPGSQQGPAVFPKLAEALEQCVRTCRHTKPTVKLVKKHLDVLRDGVQLLKIYEAELTAEAIRAVADAHATVTHQAAQLKELGDEASNVETATTCVTAQLESEQPWRDIAAIERYLLEIQAAYVAERQRLLQWQERQAEAARLRIKGRDGFSTLTADQAHGVLRSLEQAISNTDAEAVAPTLAQLRDPFQVCLSRTEDEANDRLDAILSEGRRVVIKSVDLALHNRELTTEADVDALVSEIRGQLLEQIRAGVHVRLL
jgi:hypothetical protein